MQPIPKTSELLSQLKQFETFTGLPDTDLEWLIERSELHFYLAGDYLFLPDEQVDHMQMIVQGRFAISMQRDGELRELGIWETGNVTGVLPFSRMTHARGYGQALEDSKVLSLHKRHFTEMVNVSYALTQALVNFMTTRVRNFTGQRYQEEKLMSLGKISAGLAHELNNPASAMVRSAAELHRKIHSTPEKFKSVITMRITPEQTDGVNNILFSKIKNVQGIELSLLEREERKDDITDWLEDNEVDNAEELAETFVDFGLTLDDLEKVHDIIEGRHVSPIMHWMESTLSLEKLVSEIQESADRIAKLVQSVKSYSHMDRGSAAEHIDIHEGIISTLIMLKHRFRQKQIQVVKNFDREMPKLKAHPGELNQVWTNLITNAIDAMSEGGALTINTYPDRQFICVDITDTGSGISEEHLSCIFDPFFTTKAMGEGTGMGLDITKKIVDKHKATIQVESRPGKTTFKLCFPKG